MDSRLAAGSSVSADPGVTPDVGAGSADGSVDRPWDLVRERINDYLIAMGVSDPLHRERLTDRIRQRLEERAAATPLEDPVEVGIEEAGSLLDDWLIRQLSMEGDRDNLFAARAAVLSGAVPNWSASFAGVSEESLAPAIRAACVTPIPAYAPLAMEPNTIELFWYRLGRALARALRRLLGYLPAEQSLSEPHATTSRSGPAHQAPRS